MKITEQTTKCTTKWTYSDKTKTYFYKKRLLTRLGIDDLINIVGIEAACKLLKAFESTFVSFPGIFLIRRRFLHAIIRNEYLEFKKEQMPSIKIYKDLAKKYNYQWKSIQHIVGNNNTVHPSELERYKIRMELEYVKDKEISKILKEHWDTLKSYGFLE